MSVRDFILLVAGFAAGAACVAFWPNGYTRQQCVIDKMRGQPQGMFSIAVDACYQYPSVRETQ